MSTSNKKIYHVVTLVALILKDENNADFRIEAGASAKLSEAQYKAASAYVEVKKIEGDEPPAIVTDDEPKTDDTTAPPVDPPAPPAGAEPPVPPKASEPQTDTVTEPAKTAAKSTTKQTKA